MTRQKLFKTDKVLTLIGLIPEGKLLADCAKGLVKLTRTAIKTKKEDAALLKQLRHLKAGEKVPLKIKVKPKEKIKPKGTGEFILGGPGYLQTFASKGTDKGLATRGYKPESSESIFERFVKNIVPVDKETTLHTNSPSFNTSPKNADGQFKRFGTDSHGGLSPHVHQPTRNVNPKTGEIFGRQGRKTGDGGVTSPGKRDVTQLYQYLYNGKYRN